MCVARMKARIYIARGRGKQECVRNRAAGMREEESAQRPERTPRTGDFLVPRPVSEVYQVIDADCAIYPSSQHCEVGDSISIF